MQLWRKWPRPIIQVCDFLALKFAIKKANTPLSLSIYEGYSVRCDNSIGCKLDQGNTLQRCNHTWSFCELKIKHTKDESLGIVIQIFEYRNVWTFLKKYKTHNIATLFLSSSVAKFYYLYWPSRFIIKNFLIMVW